MKTKFLTTAAGVVVLLGTSANALGAERVLKNLSSGPPADPLPALRANKPTATEMAAHPKTHPHLFFTAETRAALRARSREEPFKAIATRVRAQADESLVRTIPPQPVLPDLPTRLPDGSRNPAWAKVEYNNEFFQQSYVLRDVLPNLAFAYQLTGEARYAAAGRRWLLDFAGRSKLTTPGREADFHMAQVIFSLSLGYDWLAETMSETERSRVRQKLAALAEPMAAAAAEVLAAPDPQQRRSVMGGNHERRTHGMFSLAPLVLLYEVPQARIWLDREIQLHRDRLFPSGYAPNGEYMEAWDHFKSGLDDSIAFLVALRRMGGENLFNDPSLAPRFRGLPRFFLYGLEEAVPGQSWNKYGWSGSWDYPGRIFGWLAIASALQDPVAQWLALRDNGLASREAAFAYLFYDPAVKPAPPLPPSGSVYFPYSGMVKLSTGWGPEDLVIPFRCGPSVPKEVGDQNGLRIKVGSEWLLPRLAQVSVGPDKSPSFDHDLMGWFMGSPAQNVIAADPDDIPDAATFALSGRLPALGGVQFSTYTASKFSLMRSAADDEEKRLLPRVVFGRGRDQWLSDPGTQKTGDLRVVHFDPALDYVCGEAHRAYYFFKPSLSLRHILFVKGDQGDNPPYILVCDEIESDEQPRTFAWQLHFQPSAKWLGQSLRIQGKGAGLDVQWLLPSDGQAVMKQTPAPLQEERTDFVQYRTAKPVTRVVYVTALLPHRRRATEPGPMKVRPVLAEGGWAVEVATAAGTDVALFRSVHAQTVSAVGASTTGTAALLRRPVQGAPEFYVMGR